MIRQPVESSNLMSVGYDAGTMTLELEFRNGGVYQYFDVPESEYITLLAAPSAGSYFARVIRGGYRYAKL